MFHMMCIIGFRSWLGGASGSTAWLAARWGDVYVHETLISPIRRLLSTTFACRTVGETAEKFRERLKKVEAHLNSPEFKAKGGGGLEELGKSMRERCEEVVKRKGERIPK